MVTVVIGGNTSGVGKTTLACELIRVLAEFKWTAIKISNHGHNKPGIFEETALGQGSDTARYLSAGASRAFLVTATGPALPIAEMDAACDGSTHTLIESNRIIEALVPDVCLAVLGDGEVKESFARVLEHANAVVARNRKALDAVQIPASACVFCAENLAAPPPELMTWLRGQIATATARLKRVRP